MEAGNALPKSPTEPQGFSGPGKWFPPSFPSGCFYCEKSPPPSLPKGLASPNDGGMCEQLRNRSAQTEKKQEILDFLIEVFLSGGLLVYRGEFSLEHRHKARLHSNSISKTNL